MDHSDLLAFIQRSKANKVTELDLSNKGIDYLPQEIGTLSTLKTLNLSYNNLSEFPSGILELTRLEKLFVTRNTLTALPAGLSNLVNLQELDLSYNPIEKLPLELGLLCNLERLDASYCKLKALPLELTQLYHLKEINLEHNPLNFPPQKVVKRGLYALMHYLTLEKRKKEASRVMLQVFNMPEKIQPAFRQYIRYFNQMVSQANSKDVVFTMNFINQDFYQEMDLNAGVEGYLFDVMRVIQEKMELLQTQEAQSNKPPKTYAPERMQAFKDQLLKLNDSLDDKMATIHQLKRELIEFYDSLES